MDFSLILFLLVCATGAIWALDRWAWSGARSRGQTGRDGATADGGASAGEPAKEPLIVEYARAFFPVILIVFVLRSFIVEPFRIPSGSMLPSLHIGDFILVSKFSYGIRLPVVNKKVINTDEPKRGDVVVFRFPRDESINYIKRVIGLPGDHIVYEGKRLYVNGELISETAAPLSNAPGDGETAYDATRYTERLGGVEHDIWLSRRSDYGTTYDKVVPPGHYFVMGDNRDHSNDSRYWGFVPEENLVGKAFLIWFSWDGRDDRPWFWQRIAFDRIGNIIR
ncbi:MAG: signal peptidase I [Sulfurifustaceae bacterium]